MLPVAVIPLNDPAGLLLPHLPAVLLQLERFFAKVYVSLTLPTQQQQPNFYQWIMQEKFFDVLAHQESLYLPAGCPPA